MCAKGEPDDDKDVEWRDSHDDGPVDSDGKPHETYPENWHRNNDDINNSLCATGETDGDEDIEWSDSDDNSIDSEGNPYETNHKFQIRTRITLTTLFLPKVSRMAMMIPMGETVTIMTSSIVKVGLIKITLEIHIIIKMM